MSRLADRIQHVLDQNWVGSARQWALNADLSSKHVSTYLDRAKKNPDADMERENVLKLAEAAKVSPSWLLTGEGSARGDESSRIIEHYVNARIRELRRKEPALRRVAESLHLSVAAVRHAVGGGMLMQDRQETWAKALGMLSVDELRNRASEWWRLHGQQLHAVVLSAHDTDPERALGNALARSWGAIDIDILAALERDDGGEHDREWWFGRFMAEMKRRVDADQHEEHVVVPERQKKQAVTREAQRVKKAPKSQRSGRQKKAAVGE